VLHGQKCSLGRIDAVNPCDFLSSGSNRTERGVLFSEILQCRYKPEQHEQLEKTYYQRSRVETAIGVCKDLGLGPAGFRGRVRVKSHVFLVLCLGLAVALANYHRWNDVASPNIMLWDSFCTTAVSI